MSNIMQYLIQMNDDARESYEKIDKQILNIIDKIDLLAFRIQEIETRININRRNDE